ncbi:MAG: phosphoribosylformylglycinamidine synthase subunit PurS [Phycisphaera sp.]|nr:MAG: phosphoribosylformylglycinamidine synthase subunit PurS [Phycisphaera sp.]
MPIHRLEVRPKRDAGDPKATRLMREAAALGYTLQAARTAKVYLLEGDLTDQQRDAIARALLVNPVTESLANENGHTGVTLEVHPLPGVMDPAAQSVEEAIAELLGVQVQASTGTRYDLEGLAAEDAKALAARLLFNPVVQALHDQPFHPNALPHGTPYQFKPITVEIASLDDAGLERLSREGHLFLSLGEMCAIQQHYQTLGREPTDIELETLAQTWSEHCVHKTLKSDYHYRAESPSDPSRVREHADPLRWENRPGVTIHADGSITIANLLKNTVAAATHELIADGIDWTLSIFHDNSGVVAFDDDYGVCIKVETHNHPSALEPYGGAATGIGGCIRDIIGTGLAAKPIANTDVFCVAPPDTTDVPAGCIHPKRVLREVVAGVRDYGNRMGIPTLNGAVEFDPRYIGNPLVFAGSIGLIPRDKIDGDAQPGDRIIALGGRTGRDGIHGATFSSAELSDTHADEFSHAVQIGNPIEEKKVLDAILRARDEGNRPLFSAITDCGAGGFSSAIGEMGEKLGADVQLDQAPLKYAGLTYTEIWISEAQERMVMAVPEKNLAALQAICDEEGVELANLGHFGTPDAELILRYGDNEVGRLAMEFVHGGIPRETLPATWSPMQPKAKPSSDPNVGDALLKLLAHPSIASKHWIVRQYDHEVQGNTVLKPLVGPPAEDGASRGPGDASVIEPVPGTGRGVAIGCGLQTRVGDPAIGGDPYLMALAAIDECVRNLVCVGADPSRIAILDNFCWPGVKDAESLGHLVRAAIGCYDGAKAYRTPFVSGKDSLNNQFRTDDGTTIRIPPTLLITGLGIVHDIEKCVTSDAKQPGNTIVLVDGSADWQKLAHGPKAAAGVARAIEQGMVRSAHDVSDGGVLVALAEMLIAGSKPQSPIGAGVHGLGGLDPFEELPCRYLLEVAAGEVERLSALLDGVSCEAIAVLDESGMLQVDGSSLDVEEMARAWRAPLDW